MNLPSVTQQQTRRHFFQDCGVGVGSIALANLLAQESTAAKQVGPLTPRDGHFKAKAKNVIFLFMAGGPSQLELFDDKPKLKELDGQLAPDSFFPKEKSFAFIGKGAKLLGSARKFKRHGPGGAQVSELLPNIAGISKDLCFLKGMTTDVFNHGPAKLFMNTGFQVPGRPAMGSWVTYGLGSESRDLPGFVVLQSGPRGPRAGNSLWASGFLPTSYQGVPFRGTGDPILNLTSPKGINAQSQADFFDVVGKLNQERLQKTGDPEISTRLNAYEMAYRMQTSVPELTDFSDEPQHILDMYGPDVQNRGSYAYNCLLARRMAERDVRFIQLYHMGWDQHFTLPKQLPGQCRDTDQPSAALIKDLKQRGLLEDTLVVWGGEFGRTSYCQGTLSRDNYGRDHHPRCFSLWMAGGGVRPGLTYGSTDEFCYNVTENPVHVHDLHATILHQLGIDHEKLTYFFQGRHFRLTDVHGHVVRDVLA